MASAPGSPRGSALSRCPATRLLRRAARLTREGFLYDSSNVVPLVFILKSVYHDVAIPCYLVILRAYFHPLLRLSHRTAVKDVEKAILGLLKNAELELTPSNIARNTGYSGGYIRRECNRLSSLDLLEKDDTGSNPFYSITDRGRAYLSGELDAGDLDDESH